MSTVERTTIERVRELNNLLGSKSYFHVYADNDVTWVTIEVEENPTDGRWAEISFGYAHGAYNQVMDRRVGKASHRIDLDTDLERMRFRMHIAALMDVPYVDKETYYTTHENRERPT